MKDESVSEENPARYNDLLSIEGHKNFYRNPASQKITYKRGQHRFATGHTKITKAKEFAEQELARRQGQVISNVRKRLKGVSNPRLLDAWELMLDQKKNDWRGTTLRTYNKSWNVGLQPFWGERFAMDLTPQNILDFKNWYLKNHPTRQFEKTLIHFQVLLKMMLKEKMIGMMPDLQPLMGIDALIDKNARRVKPGRVATAAELEALEAAAAKYHLTNSDGTTSEHKLELGLRARLGLALGALCGVRKMEGLSLLWENIDLKKMIMKVWSTKNDNWREIPIVPKLEDLFLAQYELTGHTIYVFPMPTDPGRHISGQVFDKIWIQLKETAEIEGRFRYHDLRHTFASTTADEGWPTKVACEILDMSLQMYDRVYAKASFGKKTEMMLKTFGGGA